MTEYCKKNGTALSQNSMYGMFNKYSLLGGQSISNFKGLQITYLANYLFVNNIFMGAISIADPE